MVLSNSLSAAVSGHRVVQIDNSVGYARRTVALGGPVPQPAASNRSSRFDSRSEHTTASAATLLAYVHRVSSLGISRALSERDYLSLSTGRSRKYAVQRGAASAGIIRVDWTSPGANYPHQ